MQKNTFTAIVVWLEKYANFYLYSLMLFLTMFTAYGLFAHQMGFNYDDWEGVFLYHQGFSVQQVWEYFLVDRPFSSIVHWLFHPILGTSVLGWHMLTLILHWGALLFIVKTILELFPGRVIAAGWIGFLLALFPGISRHFVARTSAPHYFSMFLFAFSLWLMIRAVNSDKVNKKLLVFSVALGLIQSLVIEYFASMEIARFFILLYLFKFSRNADGKWIPALKKAFSVWLPFLGVFLIFAYFKFIILPDLATVEGLDSKHDVSLFASLLSEPFSTIIQYANLIIQDVVYVVFYVWSVPINPSEINIGAKSFLASWLMGILMAFPSSMVILYWHYKQDNNRNLPVKTLSSVAVLALSLVILLLGGLPAWIIGRQGIVGLWSSRFFLAQVIGAVPIFVILILWIIGWGRPRAANIVFSVLFVMAFSTQFREANRYTLYWGFQRDYYWQLKWRAPGLVDKTFILSPYTPFFRNADYQIAYAINLAYAPKNADTDSKYWWFDGPDSLRHPTKNEYLPNTEVIAFMRNINFESDMSFALPVLSRPSRGCLQVISDNYYQGQPGLSFEEEQMFSLAKDDLILLVGQEMPEEVFGKEPEHGWCYYYQKAELARQFNNWDEISKIWNIVQERKLTPTYGPEYLPFIDLLVMNGDWHTAAELTIASGKITKDARPFLCNFWQNVLYPRDVSDNHLLQFEYVKTELTCK